MTTFPDLGQAHDTCGGVELVDLVPNANPTIGQRKNQRTNEPQKSNRNSLNSTREYTNM